jgi:ribosomal protein S6--L-glutamate ligase
MKIALVSRVKNLYANKRLAFAARMAGHELWVAHPDEYSLELGSNSQSGIHAAWQGELPDIVLCRMGADITRFEQSLLQGFEDLGLPVINPVGAQMSCKDKFAALQRLSACEVPVPRSIFVRHPARLNRALDELGPPPWIVKTLTGATGFGVVRVDSHESARSFFDAMWSDRKEVFFQEFIRGEKSSDLRVLALGGEPVCGIRRFAREGEFRANVHRGGLGRTLEISREIADLTRRAAGTFSLPLCGVDMMESENGPLVLEVNASPGFEGLEKTTGEDVAERIITFLESYVTGSRVH